MDKNFTPIDPKEIKIEFSKLDPPDFRIDYEIPQKLTKRIYKKLKKGGFNYDEQQMIGLLTQICVSEGMERLDQKTIWGPKPMPDSPPITYSVERPFTFSSIVDTFTADDKYEIDVIPIERLNIDITDEMIDAELYDQQLEIGVRKSHAGVLEYGDVVVGTATLTIEGENDAEFNIEECNIRIPKTGQTTVVGGFQLEDAGEQLRGIQPDGFISVGVSIPQSHPNAEFRGKPAILQIDVDSVDRITPASIDEVMEQYGTPNETILRTQIQLSLKRNFDRENDFLMLNQMYVHLGETLDIPIPDRIIESRFAELCEKEQEHDPDSSELSEETKEFFLKKAKFSSLRRAITVRMQEFLDLRVSENDIEDQIRNIAELRRERPEDVRAEFVSEDKIHFLGNMSMEYKIFNRLKENMEFKDSESNS